jgi:hypothetical protein
MAAKTSETGAKKRLLDYGNPRLSTPVSALTPVPKKQKVPATFKCPTTTDEQKTVLELIQNELVSLEAIHTELDSYYFPSSIHTDHSDVPKISITCQKYNLIFVETVFLVLTESSPAEPCHLKSLEQFIPLLKDEQQTKILIATHVELQRQLKTMTQLKSILEDWKKVTIKAVPCGESLQIITPSGQNLPPKGQIMNFDRSRTFQYYRLIEWLVIASRTLKHWDV